MSTTDKALHDNKLSQLVLGGGAAASILLPRLLRRLCHSFSPALRPSRHRRCPIAQACAAAAVEAAWGAWALWLFLLS